MFQGDKFLFLHYVSGGFNLKTEEKTVEVKTNVMRLFDRQKLNYRTYDYSDRPVTNGEEIAAALGQNPLQVFKTLVTVGKTKNHYVFMLPVCCELDLKKAAAAVGEKNIEMIKQKELFPLTGYVHGGCSPLGMKKQFMVTIDSGAENFPTIIFSAGKIGCQVEIALAELQKVLRFQIASLV